MATTSTLTPEQEEALLNGPALAPPPNVVPNLINPPGLWRTGVAVETICLTLATIAVLMRVFTKLTIVRQIGLEDYAIAVGWCLFIAFAAACFEINNIAPAIHQWDVQLKNLGSFLYQTHVASVEYSLIILSIKISILLQYLRIFVPIKGGPMYWACHLLIWLNTVFYVLITFIEIFSCRPIAKVWNPLITNGHCINIFAVIVASGAINSFSDIVILILPQLRIWRLQMPTKRKVQISLIFLIGVFACIASVVRLYYATKLITTPDTTYYIWFQGLWTILELGFGFLAACLPVSAKLVNHVKETSIFTKLRSSLSSIFSLTASKGSDASSGDRELAQRFGDAKLPDAIRGTPGRYKEIPSGQLLVPPGTAVQSRAYSEETIKTEEQSYAGIYVERGFDVRETV